MFLRATQPLPAPAAAAPSPCAYLLLQDDVLVLDPLPHGQVDLG